VIDGGRIIERGSHSSLYGLGGRYFDLYTKQYGLERNLFLAPGEGDALGDGKINELSAADEQSNAALIDAVGLLGERKP